MAVTPDHEAEEPRQLDQRDADALTGRMSVLPDEGLAAGAPDLYVVVSDSGKSYVVDVREGSCECPDARYRDLACKHVRRVRFATGAREIPAWVDRSAIDPQLGQHVADSPAN